MCSQAIPMRGPKLFESVLMWVVSAASSGGISQRADDRFGTDAGSLGHIGDVGNAAAAGPLPELELHVELGRARTDGEVASGTGKALT